MAKRRRTSRTKRVRRTRPLGLRIAAWVVGAGMVLVLLGVLVVAAVIVYYGSDPDLPRMRSVRDYRPYAVTRVVDRAGALLGEISAERRSVVPLERIPQLLRKAVLAAEDSAFFEHRGLDYPGMLRALIANLRAGRFVQGGSTITQQVVKTFFLSPERTIRRKVQEVLLAQRLENELGKREILFLYLNQIYFGHGRYGVEEASRFYFGKPVEQTSLAEGALLAGLPQGPERLSPLKHPERAKQRQAYVLRRMIKLGYVSAQVGERLIDEPIRLVRHKLKYVDSAREITDLVRADLLGQFGEQGLSKLGARIETTVDAELQLAAREAVQQGLRAFDARQGYRKALRRIPAARQRASLRRLRNTQKSFAPNGAYLALVREVDDPGNRLRVDLGAQQVDVDLSDQRYNPGMHAATKRFAPGDLIRVKCVTAQRFVFDPGPQAALVALDPRSGDLVAMVGGYDYEAGEFNRATRAARPPGSAFKPFVYAAALDSGRYTAASVVDDAPVVLRVGSSTWEPRNFDDTFRGPIRLREALTHSINTVSARLIDDLGAEKVRGLAQALGIQTPLHDHPSLALGAAEVRPLELAAAYAAIANGGNRVQVRVIAKVGEEQRPQAPPERALRAEVAYVLTSLLQSVVREGTGRGALQLRRPVAGKTGTTNEAKDAWFVGFTPQLVTAVWVGFDQPRSLGGRESGGRVALPIWLHFMKEALKGKPKLPFSQPTSVTVASIDPETGLLSAPGAIDALEEVFVSGTEPTERAPGPDLVDPNTILMNPTVP